MPTEIPVLPLSYVPNADLSAKQYHFVKFTGNKQIGISAAGENSLGILQNKPSNAVDAKEKTASVEVLGKSEIVLGGTVSAGDSLMSDADGKAVVHTGVNALLAIADEGGVAGDYISCILAPRAGIGISTTSFMQSFYFPLNLIADGDILTEFTPGFAGSIEKIQFRVIDPVTTAAKATTLNFEIGTTDLTGGVLSLTSANCTPLGAVVSATAITANNTFSDSDTISIEASSTTAFIEGTGEIIVTFAS